MKNKILTFIIGVLVGAIIATVGFYIYSKSNVKQGFNQRERPEMSEQNRNGENLPEKPDGELKHQKNDGNTALENSVDTQEIGNITEENS